MRYMLLIYGEQPSEEPSPEVQERVMNGYLAYEKAVAEAGVRLGSDALQGTDTATTVHVTSTGERGRRSSRYTACSRRWRPRRSWISTGPSPWPCVMAPLPGWFCSTP